MSGIQISIVIPTCRRNDLLSCCLDAISAALDQLSQRENIETIVTDDGPGNEAALLIAERYAWVTHIPGPKRGPAANRNNGARAARGEWILFVDDDCIPDPNWLTAFNGAVRTEVAILEGRTICPGKRDTPFEEHVENLSGGVFWSCNLAVRKETFDSLGGFDEQFQAAGGEDMEFAWRIAKSGLNTRYEPGFLVLHPPRALTWRKIWWRTLMIKWMLLYAHKTGTAVPLDHSGFRAGLQAGGGYAMTQARMLVRYFRHFDPSSWKTDLFWLGWRWLTLPVIVPYLIASEAKFRGMLRRQSDARRVAQPLVEPAN